VNYPPASPEVQASLENDFSSEILASSTQDKSTSEDVVQENSASLAAENPTLPTFVTPATRARSNEEPTEIRMEGIWRVVQDVALVSVGYVETTRCCGRRCLTGGESVVRGSHSASETVVLCGIRPPQFLWYSISGTICDAAQLAIDLSAKMIFGVEDPSTCWLISFSLSIIPRHSSHRYLVFGKYNGSYWKSLQKMYFGYSFSIVISTLFNKYMIQMWQISHYFAWLITLLWTGVVNFFILKKLWGSSKIDHKSKVKKIESGKNIDSDPKKKSVIVREDAFVGNASPGLKTSKAGRRNIVTKKRELIMV